MKFHKGIKIVFVKPSL